MSSTFSFSRVGKLITKQFFENSRLYLFSLLAMVSLHALIFTFWISNAGPNYNEETTYIIFLVGLFISGSIFASMSFSVLGSREKGIYWLSIPATHLEKLICTIFYSTVVFTAIYCLSFYTVKSIGIAFLDNYVKNHPNTSYKPLKDLDNEFGQMLAIMIYAFYAVQALYLLGSVFFSRYSFIITTVAGALIIFAFVFYLSTLEQEMLLDANWDLIELRRPNETEKDSYFLYSVSPTVKDIFLNTVKYMWAPIFWLATWFKLKEKQL
jgi:hypothetical protein